LLDAAHFIKCSKLDCDVSEFLPSPTRQETTLAWTLQGTLYAQMLLKSHESSTNRKAVGQELWPAVRTSKIEIGKIVCNLQPSTCDEANACRRHHSLTHSIWTCWVGKFITWNPGHIWGDGMEMRGGRQLGILKDTGGYGKPEKQPVEAAASCCKWIESQALPIQQHYMLR